MPSRLQRLWSQNQLTTVFGLGHLCHPRIIEAIGLVGGWDGVWLDQEHTGMPITEMSHSIRAARLSGLDCFVRVAPTDYATIMRPLEAGANGVMAAQIRSVEQGAQVIEWARFHPQGLRGINNSGVDASFGAIPMGDYLNRANQETYIILQVEHVDALECVEKLAALKHLGCLFIGPADLSQSMGIPAKFDHPDLMKAIERVAKASRANNVPWAILPMDNASAKKCVEWGCSMMSLGHDNSMTLRGLRSLHGEFEWLAAKAKRVESGGGY